MKTHFYKKSDGRLIFEIWEEVGSGWELFDANAWDSVESFKDSFEALFISANTLDSVLNGTFDYGNMTRRESKLYKLAKKAFLADFVKEAMKESE